MGQAGSSPSDGKLNAAASSDGRGGTESTPGAKSGLCYIYYRLYVADSPLESINPIYSNDHFTSRILSKSVAPPHTAASLKKYLCRIEGFGEAEECTLYLSLSDKTPVEDVTRLYLRGAFSPGLSELDPIALVVDIRAADKRPPAATGIPLEHFNERMIRCVHYRLYEENGEVVSKTCFDETDSSLGRINTLSIPPPHTVASFKAHLIKAEGVSGRTFQLFEDVGGETILNDDDNVPLLADTYPGARKEEPIAVLYISQKETSTLQPQAPVPQPQPQEHTAAGRKKRKKTKTSLPQSPTTTFQSQTPGFSKRIKAIEEDMGGKLDPLWHSVTVGEILQTDGILRTEMYRPFRAPIECYTAINASGKKAFVYAWKMRFCDLP